VFSGCKVLEFLVEVGWERGLGVECEEGEADVDVLSEKGLVVLTVWIESVCVGASRIGVCPELVSHPLLVRSHVRH